MRFSATGRAFLRKVTGSVFLRKASGPIPKSGSSQKSRCRLLVGAAVVCGETTYLCVSRRQVASFSERRQVASFSERRQVAPFSERRPDPVPKSGSSQKLRGRLLVGAAVVCGETTYLCVSRRQVGAFLRKASGPVPKSGSSRKLRGRLLVGAAVVCGETTYLCVSRRQVEPFSERRQVARLSPKGVRPSPEVRQLAEVAGQALGRGRGRLRRNDLPVVSGDR